MATVRVRSVTICGCGLIGGSIGLDIQRRAGRGLTITVYDRPGVLKKIATDKRFRVRTEGNLRRAVEGADIIVLAASHEANETMLECIAGIKSLTGCLVIDTGAVKTRIARKARELAFPKGSQFLPTHPMAGKERAGFENAEAGVFRGRTWFVDDEVKLIRENRGRLEWLMGKTGGTPVFIGSELHDDLVAEISHLPQLLSTVLGAQVSKETISLAGPGLRSMLRLAGSPYSVWSEIIDQNRDNIVKALQLYRENLQTLTERIQQEQSLQDIFAAAARSYQCLS